MNERKSSQGNALFERCVASIRELEDVRLSLTDQEQDLHDKIKNMTDPLEWDEDAFDPQVAKAMLKTMATIEDRKIQISVLFASVRRIQAIASYPTDTYI